MDRIAHAVDTIPSTYSQVSRAVSSFCVGWDSLFVDLNMPRSHCFSSDECIQRSLDWSNRTMLRMYQDVFSTVVCFVFSFCINEPEDARFRYIVLRLPTSSPDFRCLWVQAIPVLYTLYTLCRNVVRLDVWIQCIQQTSDTCNCFFLAGVPQVCSHMYLIVFVHICPKWLAFAERLATELLSVLVLYPYILLVPPTHLLAWFRRNWGLVLERFGQAMYASDLFAA